MLFYKVYSGRANRCMCGCAGRWAYTKQGAVSNNPGYTPTINEQRVKSVVETILADPNHVSEDGIIHTQQDNRVLVAYFE